MTIGLLGIQIAIDHVPDLPRKIEEVSTGRRRASGRFDD